MEEIEQLTKRIDVKMTQELFDAVVELAPTVVRPNRRGRQGKQAEFCRVAIADYVSRKRGRAWSVGEASASKGERAVVSAMRADVDLAAAVVILAELAAKNHDARDLVAQLAATLSRQGKPRRHVPKARRM